MNDQNKLGILSGNLNVTVDNKQLWMLGAIIFVAVTLAGVTIALFGKLLNTKS